jgi:hypothetical protein
MHCSEHIHNPQRAIHERKGKLGKLKSVSAHESFSTNKSDETQERASSFATNAQWKQVLG